MNHQTIREKGLEKSRYIAPVAIVREVKMTQSFLQVTGSGTVPGGAGDGGEF